MYKASMSREEIRLLCRSPESAVEFLIDQIKEQMNEDEVKPEWYDVTATDHEDYVEIVAKLNESKKKHFEENRG